MLLLLFYFGCGHQVSSHLDADWVAFHSSPKTQYDSVFFDRGHAWIERDKKRGADLYSSEIHIISDGQLNIVPFDSPRQLGGGAAITWYGYTSSSFTEMTLCVFDEHVICRPSPFMGTPNDFSTWGLKTIRLNGRLSVWLESPSADQSSPVQAVWADDFSPISLPSNLTEKYIFPAENGILIVQSEPNRVSWATIDSKGWSISTLNPSQPNSYIRFVYVSNGIALWSSGQDVMSVDLATNEFNTGHKPERFEGQISAFPLDLESFALIGYDDFPPPPPRFGFGHKRPPLEVNKVGIVKGGTLGSVFPIKRNTFIKATNNFLLFGMSGVTFIVSHLNLHLKTTHEGRWAWPEHIENPKWSLCNDTPTLSWKGGFETWFATPYKDQVAIGRGNCPTALITSQVRWSRQSAETCAGDWLAFKGRGVCIVKTGEETWFQLGRK